MAVRVVGENSHTLVQAKKRSDAERWVEAAMEEMWNHEKNRTWTLQKALPGAKIIDSM
jgi:hypothetical protein